MRAAVMHAAADVRTDGVPDSGMVDPTAAIVRVTTAWVCGSDPGPHADMERSEAGRLMGHEAIVEDVGVAHYAAIPLAQPIKVSVRP